MPARYVHSAPVHLNGDIFAAVDVETTGLDPSQHSIIEIAVLPLLSDYTVNKEIIPFTTLMQPIEGKAIDPEALTVNKINLSWVKLNCLDAYKVADLLMEWAEKINPGFTKKIVPIAQNFPFDYGFLIAWLGRKSYDLIFSRNHRDTMTLANSINDRCDMHNRKIPFPRTNLKYLAAQFGFENPDPHRAMGDAATTAEVYRQLLKMTY